MKVVKTIRAGEAGSQRFLRQYGENLIAVRYRKSTQHDTLLTTIELIVDTREANARNNTNPKRWVAIQIDYEEFDLRNAIKKHGGRWSATENVWLLEYAQAVILNITSRIIPDLAGRCDDEDLAGNIRHK